MESGAKVNRLAFAAGVAAQVLALILMLAGIAFAWALRTPLEPFRYMEF